MNAAAAPRPEPSTTSWPPVQGPSWAELHHRAPRLTLTMTRFLDQLAVSARPRTVDAYAHTLRQFAGRVVEFDPACVAVGRIERRHIEDYKTWLARRPGQKQATITATTIRHRLGLMRSFFERIIDWDYDDAPTRVPIFPGDFPPADEQLPKFLDDPTAAKFMAALATEPNPHRRLAVELLARTGMRIGELEGLRRDAMVLIGDTHWLRVPVGKLHNDRYIPLHPVLVELITRHLARQPAAANGRMITRHDGQPLDRRTGYRWVRGIARRAGIANVHPHQLRHTLATQAINRGMSLEAIAALLGHRSMRMTLVYARVSDRTVAEEYFRVTQDVEANYQRIEPAPIVDGANMRRLAADHRRLLGNGHCNRPIALDCSFETICERCGFYETGPEFIPVLLRQRDHAIERDQHDRAEIYDELLDRIDNPPPT